MSFSASFDLQKLLTDKERLEARIRELQIEKEHIDFVLKKYGTTQIRGQVTPPKHVDKLTRRARVIEILSKHPGEMANADIYTALTGTGVHVLKSTFDGDLTDWTREAGAHIERTRPGFYRFRS